MTKPNTINLDSASRLLGIAPSDLESLAKSGAVHRVARDAYSITPLVQSYIAHIKTEAEKVRLSPRQVDVATHLDLSERSVREILADLGLDHKQESLDTIRTAYIRDLREKAAGRASSGDLDLVQERARLAKEQADKVAMANQIERRELAPVNVLEQVIAKVGKQIAATLEAIPVNLKRASNSISTEDLAMIEKEIIKVRNIAAAMEFNLDEMNGSVGDSPSDTSLD